MQVSIQLTPSMLVTYTVVMQLAGCFVQPTLKWLLVDFVFGKVNHWVICFFDLTSSFFDEYRGALTIISLASVGSLATEERRQALVDGVAVGREALAPFVAIVQDYVAGPRLEE